MAFLPNPAHADESVSSVIVWGNTNRETASIRATLTNLVAISGKSENFRIALRKDGTVVGWGNPGEAALNFPPNLTNVTAIAGGLLHSLFLFSDGSVQGYGGFFAADPTPPPGLSNVIAIAAGNVHSLALKSDGNLVSWGAPLATEMPDITNAVAIAAGSYHDLALRKDGTVVAWGLNAAGQCDVPPNLDHVVAIAAGNNHSAALKSDGTVVVWGEKFSPQVLQPPPEATNIVKIVSGDSRILALRQDGRVFAWGSTLAGESDILTQYTNCVDIAAVVSTYFAMTFVPVIIQQPSSMNLPAGSTLVLEVVVQEPQSVEYQWLRDGQALPGATNRILRVTRTPMEWSGSHFTVVVRNALGTTISDQAVITLRDAPPKFLVQPPSTNGLIGSTFVLQPEVEGNDPIYYQWFYDSRPLPGETNLVLTLTNLSELNQGHYELSVTNRFGSTRSASGFVLVHSPSAVATPPSQLTLPAGTNMILRIEATGTEPLFYQWRYQDSNLAGATNKSLALTNFQAATAGQYSIVISNAFGMITNEVYDLIYADSPPVIYTSPASTLFQPEGQAVFQTVVGGSAPVALQWWHGDTAIPNATNTLLVLNNLQAADAGNYFVVASNAFGSARSSEASLSIGDPFPSQIDWPTLDDSLVVTNNFLGPTCIANAGDGSGRLFIVEQAGRIKVLQNGVVRPFLEITNRVLPDETELGLLGLAFSPGFSTNGHFYVNYTRPPDRATVISRFNVSADTGLGDTNSEQIVLTIPQPLLNNKGGQLAFGPDGYLYIGTGDGGYISAGDLSTTSQDSLSLLGKILRINVESGVAPYAIPMDNPFVTNSAYAPEIWALGLRNPWRFSFDRATGDLYVGDVGHEHVEEIDFQPAHSRGGQNYGWSILEGTRPYRPPAQFDPSTLTEPVVTLDHPDCRSIIGGYVYRGPYQPRMNGLYFYGDYISGRIWGLKKTGTAWQTYSCVDTPYRISTFGEDEQGAIYFAHYQTNRQVGQIFRLYDSGLAFAPTITPPGGAFDQAAAVTLNTTTPGAIIRYTTDGRDPTEMDPGVPPGTQIEIGATRILTARAYRAGLIASSNSIAQFSYVVAAPAVSPIGAITNGTAISITTTTPGAIIHYTTDGSEPDFSSPIYSAPFAITVDTVLKTAAYKPGFDNSSTTSATFSLAKTAAPQFSPASGPITNGSFITISAATPDTIIRYTTDGSNPDSSSPVYMGPFAISGNTAVNAVAFQSGLAPSPITSTFFILAKAAAPKFDPPNGPITNGTIITITSETLGAVIYYTTDGSNPNLSSPAYSEPLSIPGNTILNAIAYKPEFEISPVTSVLFSLFKAATPEFNPPPGPITNGTRIAMTTVTLGATIRYTLDNSDPGPDSLEYHGPISIQSDTIVKARAFGEGLNVSDPQIGSYPLIRTATPHFTPGGGPATNGTIVSISCATPGALIHYTLDGSDPTAVSMVYNSPLVVTGNLMLKAFASKPNYGDSDIQSAEYGPWLPESVAVTTLAGSTVAGWRDGPGYMAQFNSPQGICVDSSGNVYVADTGNNMIRRIDTNGMVTTLAGSGKANFKDGTGTNALFNVPAGICFGPNGDLFVVDRGNQSIRRVTLSGKASTFAGHGQRGRSDGPPNQATFEYDISHISADAEQNLYVGSGGVIRQIQTNGYVTSIPFTPVYTAPDLSVVVGGISNFFMVSLAPFVTRWTPPANEELYAGMAPEGFADGPRLSARFSESTRASRCITRDNSGNLYIGDSALIRKIRADGTTVTTLAGSGTLGYLDGKGTVAQFNQVGGLAVDAAGNVYVADLSNHVIRKIWPDSDGDGIPDALEGGTTPYIVGVDDQNVDSDHDGMNNAAEFHAGTDPNDPASFLSIEGIQRLVDNHIEVRWRSIPGKHYLVKYSDDLLTWNLLGPATGADGATTSMIDPSPIVPHRIYRIFLVDF